MSDLWQRVHCIGTGAGMAMMYDNAHVMRALWAWWDGTITRREYLTVLYLTAYGANGTDTLRAWYQRSRLG